MSDLSGTDFTISWCKRFGMPCGLDDRCCGEVEDARVMSFEHAQDVLRNVEAERDRYIDRLRETNEVLRIYVDLRDGGTPARPGWLEEEIAANDRLLDLLVRRAGDVPGT